MKSGRALTLAGSQYVLVEFSSTVDYQTMHRGLNNLIHNGYMPILAHVERYFCIHKQADKLYELSMMGCYIQMNCTSLMGGILDTEASYNRRLVQNDLIHFVSSDSHSDRRRAPMMRKAVNHLLKKCHKSQIMKIALTNPNKILENTYI